MADPSVLARRVAVALALLCAVSIGCATSGTGTGTSAGDPDPASETPGASAGQPLPAPAPGDPPADPASASAGPEAGDPLAEHTGGRKTEPDPDEPGDVQAQRAPSELQRRAEGALEGMIIGTVLGGQVAGLYGAAAGAAVFGLYGVITGDVPFDAAASTPRRGGPDPDEALDQEIEQEAVKQDQLEGEIEEELRRQEELMAAIERQEQLDRAVRTEQHERGRERGADPLAAPATPYERTFPASIFDQSERKVGGQRQIVKRLDADRDGRPEVEIVSDAKSGRTISRAEDTDYDGILDAYNTYGEDGSIEARAEDTNEDGLEDRWTTYRDGRGTRVEVDRDHDGKRDAFQTYRGDSIAYEEHDLDGDGRIDRRIDYTARRRTLESEDTDKDGRIDLWTRFDETDRPTRVERDANGDGRADVFEVHEGPAADQMQIARKEEDLDGDGQIDVVSHYSHGKLVRKDVQNPGALGEG
jgi:hypothetical protein